MPITADWIAAFAHALNRVDQDDAASALLAAIRSLAPFDMVLAVVYHRDTAPTHVFDTASGPRTRRAVELYVNGTYLLNPVYNGVMAGMEPGVHMVRDLAPDEYFLSDLYKSFEIHRHDNEELGYRTYGWPAGMEELVLLIDLPDDQMGEIGLLRAAAAGGFNEAAQANLKRAWPLIAAIFRRLWAHRTRQHPPAQSRNFHYLLKDFGQNTLSPREREVAILILKGHSSESISQHLGIATATVKTHRKNLYAKLGISTQQELFSTFLRGLNL